MTTRIIPHCIRRTSATFWKVQELTASGAWRDWPGLFATRDAARMAIEASRSTRDVPLLAREGDVLHQTAGFAGLRPGATSSAPSTVATAVAGARSTSTLTAVVASGEDVEADRSGIVTTYYRALEPHEMTREDRDLAQVFRLEAELCRRVLQEEAGVALPPLPPVRVLLRTDDAASATAVNVSRPQWQLNAAYCPTTSPYFQVVSRRKLDTTIPHLAAHEVRHFFQHATGFEGDRIAMELDAEEFAVSRCRGGCSLCRVPVEEHARVSAAESSSYAIQPIAASHTPRRVTP